MKQLELIDIEWKIKEVLKKLNVPSFLEPDFLDDEGNARDSRPFLMYHNGLYFYDVIEREKKIKEKRQLMLTKLSFGF